ncbi:MAG: hypothetical protein ABEI86_12030, partial [Halobacteriaceae archaeon]
MSQESWQCPDCERWFPPQTEPVIMSAGVWKFCPVCGYERDQAEIQMVTDEELAELLAEASGKS